MVEHTPRPIRDRLHTMVERLQTRRLHFEGPNHAVWGDSYRKYPDRFYIHFTPVTWEQVPVYKNPVLKTISRYTESATGINLLQLLYHRGAQSQQQAREYMQQGMEDVQALITKLQSDSDFQRIQTIHGRTNYRMAAFAINKLGFHIDIPDDARQGRSDEDILKTYDPKQGAPMQKLLGRLWPRPVPIAITKTNFYNLATPETSEQRAN